ncbi:hypothetical protein [Castellaniella defragrans]|uniref:hypothetical protein n=1 Tax=Castellaniella defragrans TaxID=75697 RepID=UPI00187DADC7|nr:hypothetical protein [Castellaniella defragrans]
MAKNEQVARRLSVYQDRLISAGFKRISAYVSADLVALLQRQKVKGECTGRTLERLLLGSAAVRPTYYTEAESEARAARQQEWAGRPMTSSRQTKAERRAARKAEYERLRREVMERLGLRYDVDKS